jgi:hypothetical protein
MAFVFTRKTQGFLLISPLSAVKIWTASCLAYFHRAIFSSSNNIKKENAMQNQTRSKENTMDTHARVDEVLERVNGYFSSAKEYVTENPKEAAALAVAVVVAGWALLYTKPGRSIFEKGAGVVVPQLSDWISQNFSSAGVTKH